MSNILIARLTTGEEIIAKASEGENHIILEDPLMIIPTGEGKLTFATWLPYNADDVVNVGKDFVVFTIKPVEEMVKNYKQATGDVVIATPNSGIIV